MREDRTYGLNPARLGRPLASGQQGGSGQANPHHGPTLSELLQEILSSDLPLDPTSPDSLPVVLNWPSHEVLAVSGRTIGELLLDCWTDLAVIKTLKDYAKELVHHGPTGSKQTVVTAIYYAAIANALVFHQHRITKYSYHRLEEAYTELEHKPWISSELKELFRKARTVCRQRMGEP